MSSGHPRSRSTLHAALVLLALSLAAPLCAQPPPTPAPSPSDPPFWARPKQQAPPPNCACDDKAVADAPATRSENITLTASLVLGGVIVGVFLAWMRFRKPAEEPVYLKPAVEPRAPGPPPPPPPEGFDPRVARMRPPARPQTAQAQPATPEDLLLADPRAMTIELAQDEPSAETAGAHAFYAEIAASLIAALNKEPDRQDLRRKLLEIYFAARQRDEFTNLAHEYLDRNKGQPDEFWDDIGMMGVKLAPEHEMFAEWSEAGRARAQMRKSSREQRRFYERNVDQGRLYTAQEALKSDFQRLRADASFQAALRPLLADLAKRPAPLAASPELSYVADGAQIFIKHEDRRRFHDEDLINACGQILVARQLGRKRVVTATHSGIHGHAVASAAQRIGIECTIYIGERDLNRHYARVLSMRRLGANIRPIPPGFDEQADPRHNALNAWLDDPATTQYVSGLTAGPGPYPDMVREFLSVVGRETAEQMKQLSGGLPSAVVAGVADGHLGLGLLTGLLDHSSIELHCIEDKKTPADPAGIEAGLDSSMRASPTRREHRWLRETRVIYATGDDQETLRVIEQYHATGTTLYTQSARTLAYARALARRRERKDTIVVLLTGQEGADFRSHGADW